MDPAAITSSLDHVLTVRGNPAKGVAPENWAEALRTVEAADLHRAVIAVVRELVVPEWASRRKDDRRPQLALEAAEAWLATRDEASVKQAKEAAKACTAVRNETFGDDHRIPQAARSVAWAAGAKDTSDLFDALATVEEELLARVALTAEYHLGPAQRRAIVDILKRELVPPVKVEAAAPVVVVDQGPVPYSTETHFSLGQRITHKKFGEIVVTSVGESWIEAKLPDGTTKRLAHKP